jgi:hypothetical protein
MKVFSYNFCYIHENNFNTSVNCWIILLYNDQIEIKLYQEFRVQILYISINFLNLKWWIGYTVNFTHCPKWRKINSKNIIFLL